MAELDLRELTRIECLDLLRSTDVGQLALTRHALPTVVPVRYLVQGDRVIVHLATGPRSVPWRDGDVVALHVSVFDENELCGWSVSITGAAHGTPHLAHDERMPHAPWIADGGGDLIALPTDICWGERLTPAPRLLSDASSDA